MTPVTSQLNVVLNFLLIMKLQSWLFLQRVVCFNPRLHPEVVLCWFICGIEHM